MVHLRRQPFLMMLISAVAILLGSRGPWLVAGSAVSLATVGAIILTSRRSYPLMGLPAKYAVLYPLGALAALCFQIGAISRAMGLSSVARRGTRYRGGHVEKP